MNTCDETVEAIVAREHEVDTHRLLSLGLTIAAGFASCWGESSLTLLLLILVWTAVVGVPLSYPFVLGYNSRAAMAVAMWPGYFTSTRRLRRTGPPPPWFSGFPSVLDDPHKWFVVPLIIQIVAGLWGAHILNGHLPLKWNNEPIAGIALAYAVPLALDSLVWYKSGRRRLAEQTSLDAVQVMLERGYRWRRILGWIRGASEAV